MRFAAIAGLMVGVFAFGVVGSGAQEPPPDDLGAAAGGCPATPIEVVDPPPGERGGTWIYGDGIWTADFGLPVAAVTVHGRSDGSFATKFPWWRDSRVRRTLGKLRVRGRRWPGGDSLVRFRQTPGFTVPKATFRASTVTFAGPGCWWMSAKAGKARLHFVVWVVDAADDPSAASS
jgi:hypothetical protein